MISKRAEVRCFCDYPNCKEYIDIPIEKELGMSGKCWTPRQVSYKLNTYGWFSYKGNPVYCPFHTQEMIHHYQSRKNNADT